MQLPPNGEDIGSKGCSMQDGASHRDRRPKSKGHRCQQAEDHDTNGTNLGQEYSERRQEEMPTTHGRKLVNQPPPASPPLPAQAKMMQQASPPLPAQVEQPGSPPLPAQAPGARVNMYNKCSPQVLRHYLLLLIDLTGVSFNHRHGWLKTSMSLNQKCQRNRRQLVWISVFCM